MFYRSGVIFTVYVDDVIFASLSYTEIYQVIKDIGAIFYIEDKGTLNDYICVSIDPLPEGKIKLFESSPD